MTYFKAISSKLPGHCQRAMAACVRVSQCKQVQPNSLNLFKFPLIAMFWNMIFYMRCS